MISILTIASILIVGNRSIFFANNYDNARAREFVYDYLSDIRSPESSGVRINHAIAILLVMPMRSSPVVRSSFWPHSSMHAETSDSAFN